MSPIEAVLVWSTIASYALASGAYTYAIVFKNERVMPKALVPLAVGFALHTGAIAARYAAQGHLPWSGDYENGLAGGWFIVAFTLWAAWRQPGLRIVGVGTIPLTLVLTGYGLMRKPQLTPLAASLKSLWLYVHVFFAWLAFGAFAIAMGTGVAFLLRQRASGRHQVGSFWERVPELPRLDELMFRYLAFGLITDAVMIASGAIWARDLWGSYWSWDPVETWSLITWVIYGGIVHLRVVHGWRGTRLAWLSIVAIVGMVVTFFGVTFVVESSNHVFNVR